MMGDEIQEVFTYTDQLTHPYLEAEDRGLALVRFRNGSYGLIEGTTNTSPNSLKEMLCIFGEEDGTVKAGGKSVNIIEVWRFNGEGAENIKSEFSEKSPNVYGAGHTPLYADTGEVIRKNDCLWWIAKQVDALWNLCWQYMSLQKKDVL